MISLEQARGLLKRAVETQGPDFIYAPGPNPQCKYEARPDLFGDDDPRSRTGCLVGVALSLAGETRHLGSDEGILVLADSIDGLLDDDAASYLRIAQDEQDAGKTWGEAYDNAEAFLTGEFPEDEEKGQPMICAVAVPHRDGLVHGSS